MYIYYDSCNLYRYIYIFSYCQALEFNSLYFHKTARRCKLKNFSTVKSKNPHKMSGLRLTFDTNGQTFDWESTVCF